MVVALAAACSAANLLNYGTHFDDLSLPQCDDCHSGARLLTSPVLFYGITHQYYTVSVCSLYYTMQFAIYVKLTLATYLHMYCKHHTYVFKN